jgi:hypothetical protein
MATIVRANEMALTEAQKRAQQSPWNKRGVKGPKASMAPIKCCFKAGTMPD